MALVGPMLAQQKIVAGGRPNTAVSENTKKKTYLFQRLSVAL